MTHVEAGTGVGDKVLDYLLHCLSEECGEVVQMVGKTFRFGLNDSRPGFLHDNAERLAREIDDINAVAKMLRNRGHLREESFIDQLAKQAKVSDFMEDERL